jgi:cyclic-di-GMP-binding protein
MSAMHLRLSLPPRADTPDSTIEIRPAELERWLKGLPLLNVAESTQLLTRQLVGLNRMALDDKTRLRLLESMRASIQHVSQALQKTYIGLPLPLTDKARQTVAQVRQLHTEMAFGYKLLAFNSTAIPKLDHAQTGMVGTAVHRAIRYLTELLFRSYELYGPPPEGVWYEIHQLYRYAELRGITDAPLDDKLNNTLPQVSINHAYKQALLLDFSDPYHLPAFLLAKIYRYLDRWAGIAQLSPGVAALKSHCQFLINLDHDRAGAVNTETSTITTEVRYRLLNTTELARVVHQQLMVLQNRQQPDPDGLEKDFFTNLGHDMLLRLISAWGVNPKRVFTRSLRSNRRTQVAIGIDAINFHINGERFTPSTNEVGPQPRRTALGPGSGTPNRVTQPAAFPASALWELTDESAGGYALIKSGTHTETVRVGDILANRPDSGDGSWEIGIVRWVRTSGADNIEIGVQRLSPGAAPVAIMPLEDSQERYYLALALPEVHAMKQPATLLTPRGFFKSGRILYLDNSYRTRQIKAVKLVELSGSFERFQYEAIEA